MSTVKLYGYLREYSGLKAHEVQRADDQRLAQALLWISTEYRENPEWVCVAIGHMSIERAPAEKAAADAVAALRKQQADARASFEARMVEIEREINSLLAISHEVTT